MPELPEVHTTVSQLKRRLKGRVIKKVWFDWPGFFKNLKPKEFSEKIWGAEIVEVNRRGKNILLYLKTRGKPYDLLLLIHQKMTGHLLLGRWQREGGGWRSLDDGPLNEKINLYIHLVFYLTGGLMLALADVRKFAKVVLGTPSEIESSEHLKLGVDALAPGLTQREFEKIIHSERRKIKLVLLDQKVLAGLGNIYSDEALWFARVNPLTPAQKLSRNELKKLYLAVRMVLKKAIRLRGTSLSDYRDTRGRPGSYMKHRVVYGRAGEHCLRCGAIIKKIKIGGRSTSFCPNCQK